MVPNPVLTTFRRCGLAAAGDGDRYAQSAKRLGQAGFTEPQAKAVIAAVQEGTESAELAAKADIAALRAELKAEIADLRSELRQSELRLEARSKQ